MKKLILFGILLLIFIFVSGCTQRESQIGEFNITTIENSKKIAEDFIKNAPTYKFDGIPETFKYESFETLRCPYCWEFTFKFDSRQGGYGDRTNKIVIQVITPHTAKIIVQEGKIISAILDEKWDELNQKSLEVQEEIGNPILSLDKKMYVIKKNITITFDPNGTVYILNYNWYPFSIYKFENDWSLLSIGTQYGCQAQGCDNDTVRMVCIDTIAPKCEKLTETRINVWEPKYWIKEKRICGNTSYELPVEKYLPPDNYKIAYTYYTDSGCKNSETLEKEFIVFV